MTDLVPANALAYLATPYSKWSDLGAAHKEACRIAGQLMRSGLSIFSPIAHCHHIAIHGRIDPLDQLIWLMQNQRLLERCDVLIVAHMAGWDVSKGIAHEIAYFEDVRKPIFDIVDLTTLRMERRKLRVPA